MRQRIRISYCSSCGVARIDGSSGTSYSKPGHVGRTEARNEDGKL